MGDSTVTDSGDPDPLLIELFEEVMGKIQRGEALDLDQYEQADPQHLDEVRRILPTLAAMVELGRSPPPPMAPFASGRWSISGSLKDRTLGDYQIVREIGRGGMGVVYEAHQKALDRRVALKILPFAGVLDPRQLQRFKNEALASASLDHSSIVHVYSVGCEEGVHFYAMQYIEGQTLAEVLRELRDTRHAETGANDELDQTGPVLHALARNLVADQLVSRDPSEVTSDLRPAGTSMSRGAVDTDPAPADFASSTGAAAGTVTNGRIRRQTTTSESIRTAPFFHAVARLGIQAAEALDHAHSMGVVHRDIKPSNIMVDPVGHLWITDFGLAQSHADATLTMTGDVLGTLRYMSPEQAAGNRRVLNHLTDIYSLGATLYELLTLQPPFDSTDRHQLFHQVIEGDVKAVRSANDAVPKDLDTIVLKAMSVSPADRYDTAQHMAEDLRRFLEDKSILARRPTWNERFAKWTRRHRPLFWSAIASLILISLVVGTTIPILIVALKSEQQQSALAKRLAGKAESERQRAEANLTLALELLDEIYVRITQKRISQQPESPDSDEAILHSTLKFYEGYVEANRTVPELSATVQETYGKILALRRQMIDMAPTSLGARRAWAQSLSRYADFSHSVNEDSRAEAHYRQALRIHRQFVDQYPRVPEYQQDLDTCLERMVLLMQDAGRGGEAKALLELRSAGGDDAKPVSAIGATEFIRFDSFADSAHLSLLGHAALVDGRLRLTEAESAQVGGAWFNTKQPVSVGFETVFDFRMAGGSRGDEGGSDGFAFVIQNHQVSALGGNGSALGYGDAVDKVGGIPNSFAVEFDTFGLERDIGEFGDHVSVQTNGTGVNHTHSVFSWGMKSPPFQLDDGTVHTVKIRYVPGTLKVFLDEFDQPVILVAVGLETLLALDQGCAWVGFTGATGAGYQSHELLNWTYRPIAPWTAADVEALAGSRSEGDRPAVDGSKDAPSQQPSMIIADDLRLLQKAFSFYREFAKQESQDAEVRLNIGKAFWRAGEIQEWLGDFDEARPAFHAAVQAWRELVAEKPEEVVYQTYLEQGQSHLRDLAQETRDDEVVSCNDYVRLFAQAQRMNLLKPGNHLNMADWNRDGRHDLVVVEDTEGGGATVHIYLSPHSGDMPDESIVVPVIPDIATPYPHYALVDGGPGHKPDLAVIVARSGRILIRALRGETNFQEAAETQQSILRGIEDDGSVDFTLLDWNRAGEPDLVFFEGLPDDVAMHVVPRENQHGESWHVYHFRVNFGVPFSYLALVEWAGGNIPDLVAVSLPEESASGETEFHVLTGETDYTYHVQLTTDP